MSRSILINYLKDNGYDLNNIESNNLNVSNHNSEIVITGTKLDLIELADYILNLAFSNNKKDHLHLDDLTLIRKNSEIKSIIIEKE